MKIVVLEPVQDHMAVEVESRMLSRRLVFEWTGVRVI